MWVDRLRQSSSNKANIWTIKYAAARRQVTLAHKLQRRHSPFSAGAASWFMDIKTDTETKVSVEKFDKYLDQMLTE